MLKKMILMLVLLTLVLAAAGYGVLHYHYSDGVRSGRLVKISKKGMLLKTYEGTLDLGSGDGLTWHFSVHDNKVGEELVRLSGKKVQLEYTELLYKVFYQTKYNVTSSRVIELKGQSHEDFCSLVNLMRKSKAVVHQVKELMIKFQSDLLEKARGCQF